MLKHPVNKNRLDLLLNYDDNDGENQSPELKLTLLQVENPIQTFLIQTAEPNSRNH